MHIGSRQISKQELRDLLAKLPKDLVSIYLKANSFPQRVEQIPYKIDEKDKLVEIAFRIGRKGSETGAAIYWNSTRLIIFPPFPLKKDEFFQEKNTDPLEKILDKKMTLGVILLRTGAYSLGVFERGKLHESKTGHRYVKARHKKGGWSQQRFQRARKEQQKKLLKEASRQLRKKFKSYESKLDWIFFGGSKQIKKEFMNYCKYLQQFEEIIFDRTLDAPETKKRILEQMPHEAWKSIVYQVKF